MNSKKSLLKFQIGPVQDFIAAARSTRDLWSGSYLLSSIAAAALRELKAQGGEVIFPHIENQPLVEGQPASDNSDDRIAFLTPTLPNVLVALIPDDLDPNTIAAAAQGELTEIVNDVASFLEKFFKDNKSETVTYDPDRFKTQAARLLDVQWQVFPYADPKEIHDLASQLPKSEDFDVCKHVTQDSPLDDLWGPRNAIISWLLDGNKSLRQFHAWNTGEWKSGNNYIRDQLNGKEEAVFTVSNKLSEKQLSQLISELKLNAGSLKHGELLGTSTLIKRFWDNAHLTKIPNLPNDPDYLRKAHPMPNTHDIAQYKSDENPEPSGEPDKYFAVIAMDGDQMGQWISGQKFTSAITQTDHTEFCEILNDFSVNHAAGIVEDSTGKLIYAGGDDVLVMVPAAEAIHCAEDLRDAFVKYFTDKDTTKYASMDASVGIAIAHYKSPLQDVVQAAQDAEKRAKRKPKDGGIGRGAVAITIFKRSGEILEWGTKWNSAGTQLLENLLEDLKVKKLNKRFPHKLEAQLADYLSQSTSITTDSDFSSAFPDILEKEVTHTLSRNDGGNLGKTELAQFTKYWKSLEGTFEQNLKLLINLLRTAAWMARGTPDNESPPSNQQANPT